MSMFHLFKATALVWTCLTVAAFAAPPRQLHQTQQHPTPSLLVTCPDLPDDSPLAAITREWNRKPPQNAPDHERLRRHLYTLVATHKLTPEQRRLADTLSLQLEHSKRMNEANTDPQSPDDIRDACRKARNLKTFRKHFPNLKNSPQSQLAESLLRDPFNLELEKALRNAIIISGVSETWNVTASSNFTDFKPLNDATRFQDITMIHLHTTITQPPKAKDEEQLAMVFKGLPHNAVVNVDGIPQERFPADARCSFRVKLPKRFPEQKSYTIDIHIAHPPQWFQPARTWIVRTKTPQTPKTIQTD